MRRGASGRVAAAVGALGAVAIAAGGVGSAGAATASVVAPAGSLGFTIYHPPASSVGAHTATEPSIGANWLTGSIMYQADVTTYKVAFNDATTPATATWSDVSSLLTNQTTLDPILFTDPVTGRTIVSQLDVACSLSEYTDDDGASWTPSSGCAQNGSEDHQSIGGGPFHAPLPSSLPSPLYPHAVYYCNQDGGAIVAGGGFDAYCGLSLTGGLNYSPGKPIYTFQQCGGLHGHVRVAPDGTAVVPNQNCAPASDPTIVYDPLNGHIFPNQAAVVSTDNGLTWTVDAIPGSHVSIRSDPAVAFDAANRMYFAYEDGTYAGNDITTPQIGGRAMIATSPDQGATWTTPVDVGAAFGIQNVTFPEIIAGDTGRAAYAFLGSSSGGNPEDSTFKGFWYLYVAITSDGGNTWSVQNLTPGDPVERGCIYLAGNGTCPSVKRNLLDFMDITVDNHGRVLIGYADGCTATCVTQQNQPCSDALCSTGPTASTDKYSSIARETCGRSLLVAYDKALACRTTSSGSGSTPTTTTGVTVTGVPNTSAPAAPVGAAAIAALGLFAGVRRRRSRPRS